jgi:hypothetical protein
MAIPGGQGGRALLAPPVVRRLAGGPGMAWSQALEALSYIVTILGLPLAIGIFVYEQRRRRQLEESGLHRMLSEEYDNFLRLALEHADLSFFRRSRFEHELSEEQIERKHILFTILISLFEKAYIILYNERMTAETRRLWLSWEDDMREWCRREDFRTALPGLLHGEDERFQAHIAAIAEEEAAGRHD